MVNWIVNYLGGAVLGAAIVSAIIYIIIPTIRDWYDDRNAQELTMARQTDALEIWEDYQTNETRANSLHKGKWFRIKLEHISEIESGGRVRMHKNTYGSDYIELDFKNDEDVLHLRQGQSLVAICKLSGFDLDSWLRFEKCR